MPKSCVEDARSATRTVQDYGRFLCDQQRLRMADAAHAAKWSPAQGHLQSRRKMGQKAGCSMQMEHCKSVSFHVFAVSVTVDDAGRRRYRSTGESMARECTWAIELPRCGRARCKHAALALSWRSPGCEGSANPFSDTPRPSERWPCWSSGKDAAGGGEGGRSPHRPAGGPREA